MTKDINIDYLFQEPVFDKYVILNITAQSPLSICNGPNGVYYKSSVLPSNFMLMGLLENIIGIHIPLTQRYALVKELKRIHKPILFYKTDGSKVGAVTKSSFYFPIIQHHLRIKYLNTPNGKFFNDLVSLHSSCLKPRQYVDKRHIGGVKHIDAALMFTAPKTTENNNTNIDLISKHPMYYSGPKTREYFLPDTAYRIELCSNVSFFKLIQEALCFRNSWFLGNSESIVKVELK